VSQLFHEWNSFVKTNITEVHNTVTQICYTSMYSLCMYTPYELAHAEHKKIRVILALFDVWLRIIWETRTDVSEQPVASIFRIFYPEDVNNTLLRKH
jgi:hypothetical protein